MVLLLLLLLVLLLILYFPGSKKTQKLRGGVGGGENREKTSELPGGCVGVANIYIFFISLTFFFNYMGFVYKNIFFRFDGRRWCCGGQSPIFRGVGDGGTFDDRGQLIL